MTPSVADATLHALLAAAQTIAVVGHSDKPYRASYGVARYLRDAGYRVYPVNPNVRSLDGEIVYPSLRAIPDRIDIVNVFRRSEHLPLIVEDAIAIGARVVWTQLGVAHPAAAQRAQAAGLVVVQDRCIMVEHRRLGLPRRA
jgi:predicted CoA-binding protein